MEVIFSRHAIQRVQERFRIFFPPETFASERRARWVLEENFKRAVEWRVWQDSPFYLNMVSCRHGKGTRSFVRKPLIYICQEVPGDKNTLICRTVVDRFLSLDLRSSKRKGGVQ